MRSGAEALVVAAPLAFLFWSSGAVAFPPAFAALLVLALVAMAAGRLLLRAARASDLPASAAWVLGACATALLVYVLAAALQILAATAFAAGAALTLGAWLLARGKAPPRPEPASASLLALALCGAATVLWCREIAEAPLGLARDGTFPAWVDHFIHGGIISSFGDPRAVGRGAMEFADFPVRAYHYASYMLPAAFAAPLDVAGLPLSTSVWLPLGFFTMCAGAYALGAALAGTAGGIAALAAVALAPDASNFWPRNGYFSFHWNVLNTPGQAYGVGLSLLAFALLHRWTRSGDRRALAAGAVLAAGTALFRIHLFLLAFPAFLLGAAMASGFVQRRRLVSCAAAAGAFALLVCGFYAATGSAPALEYFLAIAHGGYNEPTAYTGWYQALLDSHGRGVAVPAGVLLALLACAGPFVVLYPASAALAGRAWTALPLAVLACYAALMVTAPIPPYGNPGELVQRPFVLFYAVLAVCTAAMLAGWLRARAPHAWQAALVAGVIAVPLVWAQAPALAAPKFGWGWRFNSIRVPDGLVPSAAWLRENARPGDVLAVQGLGLQPVAADLGTQLGALTGIPAYLARPSIHLTGGEREKVALERHGALLRVAGEESHAAVVARLRELGIRWYVVPEGKAPRWDPERRHAAFVSGSLAVYSAADRR